jgi:two-component system OmpR family sensor kinase
VSLRTRLVLAVAAIALVALVVADVATYSSLQSFLYDRVDQSLQQTATALPPALRHVGLLGGQDAPGGGSPDGPATGTSGGPLGSGGPDRDDQPSFVVQTQAPGYAVQVRSPTGTHSFPSYQQGGASYSPKLPARLTGFSPGAPGRPPQVSFTTGSTAAGGPDFRVLAVREPGGYTLVLGLPLSGTEGTLDRLLLIELVVTAAALVAAVLLGLWLVRLGLRPLADVEDTAERIAGGELYQRVPGENDRTEVGRLARTVNVMLGRIEQAFADRDATEAELRRSEERLRRFVADASHELRTPLAAVTAYAELFERGARDHPEDLGRAMAGIRSQASRMGRLVEDLFLLARLDEGLPLQRERVDLSDLAADAVQTATTVGPAWPVRLEAEGSVTVVGDEARLRQVLDNLLANVRSHTPEGTEVTVAVRPADDGGAVMEVADRGPGLGEGKAERVFERFYRADSSRSRASGGTGLGLSIVAAIVAAHGGRAWAADRPGGGTVMTVRLPAEPPPRAAVTVEPPPRAAEPEPAPQPPQPERAPQPATPASST